MNVTCSATPVCPIILNSTCVFYEGVDLTYIGVTTNDSIQTALEKINNSLGNYPIPTLQQVTNSGNTVTVPSARGVGIHVSIQDITTYQAAFIGEAPLQTANTTTAPTAWGGVLTTATTISHQQTISSTNTWLATRRTRFQTSTTAANTSGMRTAYVQWFRGNNPGFGGFWFRCQLGMNLNLQGGQKFVGLCASTGALAGDPSALLNMCGMGYDAADLSTGSWSFMYNDGTGTATKVDLGANAVRNTTAGYDLVMYMAPGGSELFVRIVNLATNVVVLETSYTTLLPVANTGMAFKAEVRNGAVAAADNLEIAKVYIETDY